VPIDRESASRFSKRFIKFPIPGCVGFVGFASVAGVDSLTPPKPLLQEGVDARPFSAADEEEEDDLDLVLVLAPAVDVAVIVSDEGFLSKEFVLNFDSSTFVVGVSAVAAAAVVASSSAGVKTMFPTRNDAGPTLET